MLTAGVVCSSSSTEAMSAAAAASTSSSSKQREAASSINVESTMLSSSDFRQVDFIVKTVIIGDSGVGKSCLLKRFASGNYLSDFYTTIGVDLEIKTVDLDGKLAKLQIWDTAGQERFRNITTSYYRGAHTIMLVYDVTCPSSFAAIPQWLREIEKYAAEGAQVLLVGNKSDLSAHRLVSSEDGHKLASELGIQFIETSAKSAVNVETAFMQMTKTYIDTKYAQKTKASGKSAASINGGTVSITDDSSVAPASGWSCPGCTIM